MAGVNVALLGNLEARSELGKAGTKSDLHLHDYRAGDIDVTVLVPDRYPDKVQCLSYTVLGSDVGVLVVDEVNAQVGEQILAAHAAGIQRGFIVLENYLQPEQVQPLLEDTTLADWTIVTEPDWPTLREGLAGFVVEPGGDETRIPVDHHFNVKGVGGVVLGVVKQGVVKKNDALIAYPDNVVCPVRSIQVHDQDVPEAKAGDRVGLALRNTDAEKLDRGMVLAPEGAPLTTHKVGDTIQIEIDRSPFSKQPLPAGSVAHVAFGMQFCPVRLETDAPQPGKRGAVPCSVEKAIVTAPQETGILWHVDNDPQRVVGRVALQ